MRDRIYSLTWFAPLIIVGDIVAVGANMFTMYEHWNAPWWSFIPRAFSLATLCGVVAFTFRQLWRAWKMDKEHEDNVRKMRERHAGRAR